MLPRRSYLTLRQGLTGVAFGGGRRIGTFLVAVAFLLPLLSACGQGQDQRSRPPATRTLAPGIKPVTPTRELPTVVPATPEPEPAVLSPAAFDHAGPEVTLPLPAGTFFRTVQRCYWDDCLGFALPPGTPVVAPFDGTVVWQPSSADTACSVVLAIARFAGVEEGKEMDPPGTVEVVMTCDAVVGVEDGARVRRGQELARLGQQGIYQGQPDAPPTVLLFRCSYAARPCRWAGGAPHFFAAAGPGN